MLLVSLAASGPAKCYECLAEDAEGCFASQDDQTCLSDSDSLGTTHCGSAVGTVRDKKGNIRRGFFRSCINCAGKLTFNFYKRKHQLQRPVSSPKMTKLVNLILTHLAQLTAAPPSDRFVIRIVTSGENFSEVALTVPASSC